MAAEETSGRASERPKMAVPHDLQIALHDDPEVGGVFEALPYSHKREYVDWILEARRPKTRARHIDEALRMISWKARTAQ